MHKLLLSFLLVYLLSSLIRIMSHMNDHEKMNRDSTEGNSGTKSYWLFFAHKYVY